MLPRNLTLFRFPAALWKELSALPEVARHVALKPCSPMELFSRGFVSPYGFGYDALSVWAQSAIGITLGGEDKILPSSAVAKAVAERIELMRQREGRNPGGRERKRIKDDVLTDMLPRALVRPSRVNAWVDFEAGWLVVDTASRRAGEAVVSLIRDALGSFPALPVNAEASPRALLTGWVAGEALPDGFALGDACDLRDPVEAGASVKVRNQDLDSDEIREHLKSGKQCFRLALTFRERLAFELGDDVVIRKLRFLETATEALDRDERDGVVAEVDARFALAVGEVRALLVALAAELSLSSADA
jgi:recombination associated protein RdgC